MDWQFKVGIGLAVAFFFAQYAIKDMPPAITWAGVVGGLLLAAWGLLPGHDRMPWGPCFLVIASLSGLVGGGYWYWESDRSAHVAEHVGQRLESPMLGSIQYVLGTAEIFHKQSTDQTSVQMRVRVVNKTDKLLNASVMLDGSANGKPGPRGPITFDAYFYPHDESTLSYDTIEDIPVPKNITTKTPYFFGVLDYKIRYKEAADTEYRRETEKRLRMEMVPPPHGGPPGSEEMREITVLFDREAER